MKSIPVLAACLGLATGPSVSAEELVPLTIDAHAGWINAVAFSPDGTWLVSGGDDEMIRVWDAATGKRVREWRGHADGVTSIALRPDGRQIVSGGWDNTLKVWDVRTGRRLRTFEGHEEQVTSVAYSRDGKWLVSGSGDDTLTVWDAADGRDVMTLSHENEYDVTSVAFSPDGERIVSADGENQLKLWDASTGEELQTKEAHPAAIGSVAFSPDGKLVVSGGWDDSVKVWNSSLEESPITLKGHTDDVTTVIFSADSRQIASASDDGTVRIWHSGIGKPLTTLQAHREGVTSVAFGPDGKRLVTAGRKVLKVWKRDGSEQQVQRVTIRLEDALTTENPKVRDWVLSPEVQFLLVDGEVRSPIIHLKRGWTVPSWKGVVEECNLTFANGRLRGSIRSEIYSAATVTGTFDIAIEATIDDGMVTGTHVSSNASGAKRRGELKGTVEPVSLTGDPAHDGVWTVHLPRALPRDEVLTLYLDRHDGAFTAFAFSPDFTRRPMDVDASELTFANSKLTGRIKVDRLNKENDGTRSTFGTYEIDATVDGPAVGGRFEGTTIDDRSVAGLVCGEIRHRRPVPANATVWLKCEDGYTGGAMWQNRVFLEFDLEDGAFVRGKSGNNKGVFEATLTAANTTLTRNRVKGTLKSTVLSSGSVTKGDYTFEVDGLRSGDVMYGRFRTLLAGKNVKAGYFVGGIRR